MFIRHTYFAYYYLRISVKGETSNQNGKTGHKTSVLFSEGAKQNYVVLDDFKNRLWGLPWWRSG